MNSLTEFQQRAAAAAVVKLLNNKHFSICDLDAIAKTIGREHAMAGKDYAALRTMHCVDYADMGPELAKMVREKCLELLGIPPSAVIEAVSVREPEQRSAPAQRPRLAFWKKQ